MYWDDWSWYILCMKLTTQKFESYQDDLAGYCRDCDDVTSEGIEGDAEGYNCPVCDNENVMGLDNALILNHIEIDEEAEDSDEDDFDIISFSED